MCVRVRISWLISSREKTSIAIDEVQSIIVGANSLVGSLTRPVDFRRVVENRGKTKTNRVRSRRRKIGSNQSVYSNGRSDRTCGAHEALRMVGACAKGTSEKKRK